MALQKTFLSFFLILWGIVIGIAQDAALAEYKKLVTQFEDRMPIAYQADYKYYEDLVTDTPQHELSLHLYKTAKAVYYTFEQQEVLQTNEQMVTIDHRSKTIYVNLITAQVQPTTNLSDYVKWIQLLELEGQQEEQSNGQAFLNFTSNNDSNTRMELHYDPLTFLFNQATVAFDFSDNPHFFPEYDQTKWIVHFSDYELENVQIPISISQIYQQHGTQLKGVGKYEDYLVEQL